MPKHETAHAPLAQKGNAFDVNWETIERYFNAQMPVCVTATGDPGTLTSGSPGPTSFITWSPPTNPLYDVSNIIGHNPTTSLRIPLDGFYDFWCLLQLGTPDRGFFAIRSILDTANTSFTGLDTPTWSRRVNGPSQLFDASTNTLDGHSYMEVLYRGIEFHANDLFRIGLNIYADTSGVSVGNITGSVVPFSEFRFTYGIPNALVRTGPGL